MNDKTIPIVIIAVGPKPDALRVEIDEASGVPMAMCPACGARSIADLDAHTVHLQHEDGCPLFVQAKVGSRRDDDEREEVRLVDEQTTRTEAKGAESGPSEARKNLLDAIEEVFSRVKPEPQDVMQVGLLIYENAVATVLAKTEIEDWLPFLSSVVGQLQAVRPRIADKMTELAPGKLH
jgi:hypothetical protein